MTEYKLVDIREGGIISRVENKDEIYEMIDIYEFLPIYDNQEELKQENGKGVINQWQA